MSEQTQRGASPEAIAPEGEGLRSKAAQCVRVFAWQHAEDSCTVHAVSTGLLWIHIPLTWALVGLIWVVQVVHYPLFKEVGEHVFPGYHRGHSTRITWIVGPLMLGELATVCALVLTGSADFWLRASLVPLFCVWLCTWRVQIPLHAKLSSGFDACTHRRLVQTNWWRTAAWTLRGVCLLFVEG